LPRAKRRCYEFREIKEHRTWCSRICGAYELAKEKTPPLWLARVSASEVGGMSDYLIHWCFSCPEGVVMC
jgi:hypothetical protein